MLLFFPRGLKQMVRHSLLVVLVGGLDLIVLVEATWETTLELSKPPFQTTN